MQKLEQELVLEQEQVKVLRLIFSRLHSLIFGDYPPENSSDPLSLAQNALSSQLFNQHPQF